MTSYSKSDKINRTQLIKKFNNEGLEKIDFLGPIPVKLGQLAVIQGPLPKRPISANPGLIMA